MRRIKLLWRILQMTQVDKIISGFVVFTFVMALGLTIVEPGISTYGDGLWYCFSVFTTIGFGDITAVTFIGRSLTAVLGIFSLFVVAMIPGVIVSYFMEISKARAKSSIVEFLDQLEHLPMLSKEELTELSEKVKKNRKLF